MGRFARSANDVDGQTSDMKCFTLDAGGDDDGPGMASGWFGEAGWIGNYKTGYHGQRRLDACTAEQSVDRLIRGAMCLSHAPFVTFLLHPRRSAGPTGHDVQLSTRHGKLLRAFLYIHRTGRHVRRYIRLLRARCTSLCGGSVLNVSADGSESV